MSADKPERFISPELSRVFGFVYVTLLPTGLVKIGKASQLQRVTAADSFFDEPTRPLAVFPVARPDMDGAEKAVHAELHLWRVSPKRELFFYFSPSQFMEAVLDAIDPYIYEDEKECWRAASFWSWDWIKLYAEEELKDAAADGEPLSIEGRYDLLLRLAREHSAFVNRPLPA